MYKILKRIFICSMIAIFCWSFQIVSDRNKLSDGLIRFHVIANSDDEADQAVKLKVRDAVLRSLEGDLQNISDIHTAKEYLQQNLPKIREIANRTLAELGREENAAVSLGRESYPIRHYETFSLPAGVYESLRIVIGEGEGQNWWCVAFPTLCLPATTQEFQSVAADAGLSKGLSGTLSHGEGHEIRFFLLDKLGQLQNSLFAEK